MSGWIDEQVGDGCWALSVERWVLGVGCWVLLLPLLLLLVLMLVLALVLVCVCVFVCVCVGALENRTGDLLAMRCARGTCVGTKSGVWCVCLCDVFEK